MLLLLLLAILLAGGALALVGRAALLPRIRTGENVGRIAAYGYAGQGVDPAPARSPMLPKVATRLGIVMSSLAPARQEELRKLLLAAGMWQTKPSTLTGYRVLATTVFVTLMLWSGLKGGWSPVLLIAGTVYAAAIGWIGPMFVVRSRARRRTERIEIELPELLDLLVVTLEAGVGFNAALQRASERMTGPLGDEIRLTLHEQNLGLGMDGALTNLLDRCDVPAIRSFVRTVIQSESLGVSIGQVMRDLAGDMRKRRRQIIEEKAQKAPIKMLFPLAFMILPSLLLIMLFPGLYSLVQTLSDTAA